MVVPVVLVCISLSFQLCSTLRRCIFLCRACPLIQGRLTFVEYFPSVPVIPVAIAVVVLVARSAYSSPVVEPKRFVGTLVELLRVVVLVLLVCRRRLCLSRLCSSDNSMPRALVARNASNSLLFLCLLIFLLGSFLKYALVVHNSSNSL